MTESGIAAPHRDRSRPALATGAPDAGRRLARSAAAEAAVAPPVLAAAGMVSTSLGIPGEVVALTRHRERPAAGLAGSKMSTGRRSQAATPPAGSTIFSEGAWDRDFAALR